MRRVLHRKAVPVVQPSAPEPHGCMTCEYKNQRTEYSVARPLDGEHDIIVHCAKNYFNGGYLVERTDCPLWEAGNFGVIANLCDRCMHNLDPWLDHTGPTRCAVHQTQRKHEVHKCMAHKTLEQFSLEVREDEEQRLAWIEYQRELKANRPWYVRWVSNIIERLTADNKHAPTIKQEERPDRPPSHND